MSRAGILALAGAGLLIAPQLARAQSVTTASATATLQGGYASSPYGSTAGGQSGSAFGQATIDANVQVATEYNVFGLNGSLNYKDYIRRYPDDNRYHIGFTYNGHNSSQLTTRASATYTDSAIGSLESLYIAATPVSGAGTGTGTGAEAGTGANSGTGTAPDLGLFGNNNRSRNLNFAAGLAYQLNDHNRISLDGSGTLGRYKFATIANNFNDFSGSVGYSRDINAHFALGVLGAVDATNYFNKLPTSHVYSGSLTFNLKMSSQWSFNGTAGISQLQVVGLASQTGWTANGNLCYKGSTRSDFCANASHGFSATSYSGTSITTNAGATYQYRLTERDSLSAGANYFRNENTVLTSTHSEYFTGQVGYTHKHNNRASLGFNASYSKVLASNAGQADNYTGALTLSYRIGDLH